MRIIIRQDDRGAAVLPEDGEDVLEEIELKCQVRLALARARPNRRG